MRDMQVKDLPLRLQKLYNSACKVRKNAYIPYSKFAVGAAVYCSDDAVYCGCNIENASYGLCVCAERNAVFQAVCAGKLELKELCVVADTKKPVSPCGACRQVMYEFNIETIILANLQGECKICTVEELLPYGFEL